MSKKKKTKKNILFDAANDAISAVYFDVSVRPSKTRDLLERLKVRIDKDLAGLPK